MKASFFIYIYIYIYIKEHHDGPPQEIYLAARALIKLWKINVETFDQTETKY